MSATETPGLSRPGYRYDAATRVQSVRNGRERGCWVYIPAEVLAAAEIPLDAPPPWYRRRLLRRTDRSGAPVVIVSLYREP